MPSTARRGSRERHFEISEVRRVLGGSGVVISGVIVKGSIGFRV